MASTSDQHEALLGMVYQFGYWHDGVGGLCTGGLSALELAFRVLDWDDPHPVPEMRCDEPGCLKQSVIGTPTLDGYRSTCSDHQPSREAVDDYHATARTWLAEHPGTTWPDWLDAWKAWKVPA